MKKGSRSCLLERSAGLTSSPTTCVVLTCLCRALGGGSGLAIALAELLHAAGGVHDLLLARVERVAGRAHFYVQLAPEHGFGGEFVAATANDVDFFVVGMDFGLHGLLSFTSVRAISDRPRARRALYADTA